MDVEYRNQTEVELNHIVSLGDRPDALLVADLLKIMDMVSCLSAEKHAKMSCVTLMMDDLNLVNLSVKTGQVLNVTAKLTRPFGSSMEVVVDVAVKDIFKDERQQVCKAYFTYVAIAKVGKARLERLYPTTLEEKLEYALAVERRRLRFKARTAAKEKSAARVNKANVSVPCDANGHKIAMEETRVESIELVLPGHANHHQSTFGGQIMSWLVAVCTISASKICDSSPRILAVNGVHFLRPSSVGDRILFKAMVNKVFDDNTMEVGCTVEAYKIDGSVTHINSAYLTYVCLGSDGRPKKLPVVVPSTTDQVQHYKNAVIRRQELDEKTKILKSVGPAMSIPWSAKTHDMLAMHNVTAIKKLLHQPNWIEGEDEVSCYKGEALLPIKASDLFTCLHKDRAKWDPQVVERKVIKEVDEDDNIIMLALSRDKQKPVAFVLLESRRPPSDNQECYLVALGCVSMADYQVPAQYELGDTLLAGFFINESETDPSVSRLTYIAQLNPTKQQEEFDEHQRMFTNLVMKLKA